MVWSGNACYPPIAPAASQWQMHPKMLRQHHQNKITKQWWLFMLFHLSQWVRRVVSMNSSGASLVLLIATSHTKRMLLGSLLITIFMENPMSFILSHYTRGKQQALLSQDMKACWALQVSNQPRPTTGWEWPSWTVTIPTGTIAVHQGVGALLPLTNASLLVYA